MTSSPKIRSHMVDRFKELAKTYPIIAVEPDADRKTVDIVFKDNFILRVNEAEYAILQPKIKVEPEEAT